MKLEFKTKPYRHINQYCLSRYCLPRVSNNSQIYEIFKVLSGEFYEDGFADF